MQTIPPPNPPGSADRLKAIGAAVTARLDSLEPVQKLVREEMLLYALPGFLTDEECDSLCRKIDACAMPSKLFDEDYSSGFRTSYSGNLDRTDMEIWTIECRISQLLGLDERHGEALQGQRYAVGQQFKPHHDFFYTDQPYFKDTSRFGGQRSWTAMIYLNDGIEGGETEFTWIGLKIPPQKGVLLIWDNMDANGECNIATKHTGRPVIKGTKYIVTKWFREGFWSQ